MSEGIEVPAMNQQRRISGHLICTMVELNRSLNNIGQKKKKERLEWGGLCSRKI